MNLILSRHGNTFEAGQKSVWVGARNDLPLTAQGREQARQLAQALAKNKITPSAVYCGALRRTKEYSEIVIAKLRLPLKADNDPRLNEIDYGQWSGLTNEEVIQRFGRNEFERWEQDCEWPVQGGWGGSASGLKQEVHDFAHEITRKFAEHDSILVVTSNGRLRYFLTLVEGEFERRVREKTLKVKPGNIGKLSWRKRPLSGGLGPTERRRREGTFQISCWNTKPNGLERL
ncbi:MAG: histidine phosphatase family protein [Elusimicrobiota bacterium]